jgi:hypothetical protein
MHRPAWIVMTSVLRALGLRRALGAMRRGRRRCRRSLRRCAWANRVLAREGGLFDDNYIRVCWRRGLLMMIDTNNGYERIDTDQWVFDLHVFAPRCLPICTPQVIMENVLSLFCSLECGAHQKSSQRSHSKVNKMPLKHLYTILYTAGHRG